jgi:hypothetical protein
MAKFIQKEGGTKKGEAWIGTTPVSCDICKQKIKDKFIDGRTVFGLSWGFMCPVCHKKYGVGLGVGKGQLYTKKLKRVI